MTRIFTLVSIIAVFMVLLAGGGIYWLAISEIEQSKKESTRWRGERHCPGHQQ